MKQRQLVNALKVIICKEIWNVLLVLQDVDNAIIVINLAVQNVSLIMYSIILQRLKNIVVQIHVKIIIKKKAKSAIHAIHNRYTIQQQVLVTAWRDFTS